MPSISKKQQKLFGIALAIERGELPKSYSPKAMKISKEMTESQIKEFASKVNPHKLLKNKKK